MHMTFYWGYDASILFMSWTTDSPATYLTAVIAVFFFCVFHEFLTTYRVNYLATRINPKARSELLPNGPSVPLLEAGGRLGSSLPIQTQIIASLLYGLNVAGSYLIMLVVMTFNLGLFITVVVGLSLGFCLFGLSRTLTTPASSELCCTS